MLRTVAHPPRVPALWIVISFSLSLAGCGRSTPAGSESKGSGSAPTEIPAKVYSSQTAASSVSSQNDTASTDTSDSAPPDSAGTAATAIDRPNVVVVLWDTVRADYLGFLGADKETAPFLASLAEKGAVFERAFSTSSWTAPSTASLFTSLYPPQHSIVMGFKAHRGMVDKLEEADESAITLNRLPRTVQTLPELFKAHGYNTFGAAANINIGDEMGFSRGFDFFKKDLSASAADLYALVKQHRKKIVAPKTPFFVYLHFNDAHLPYERREPYFTPAADVSGDPAARYRSEISYMDAFLKKIWQLPGISENTLLAVVSDHGEEFLDHGGTEHGPTLYIELNRVLMTLYGPRVGIAPTRIKENVSLVDLLPTLADRIGAPSKKNWEGTSLLPLVRSDGRGAAALRETLGNRAVFGHRIYSSIRKLSVWSITHRSWKLIDWFGTRGKLFDHRTDPREQNNLYNRRPKRVRDLTADLLKFKTRMKAEGRSERIEIDLDTELYERLKTLGYVE